MTVEEGVLAAYVVKMAVVEVELVHQS